MSISASSNQRVQHSEFPRHFSWLKDSSRPNPEPLASGKPLRSHSRTVYWKRPSLIIVWVQTKAAFTRSTQHSSSPSAWCIIVLTKPAVQQLHRLVLRHLIMHFQSLSSIFLYTFVRYMPSLAELLEKSKLSNLPEKSSGSITRIFEVRYVRFLHCNAT